MKTYQGTFNWHGEVHELSTKATTQARAKCNLLWQLAKKVKQPLGIVRRYFGGHADNYNVAPRKEVIQ